MTTLKQVKLEYMQYCYTKSDRTKFLYDQYLTRLDVYLGEVVFEAITEAMMLDFMVNLRQKNGLSYGKSYQSQVYRGLHTFFVWAFSRGKIAVNPMSGVPRPRPDGGPARSLTTTQVQAVITEVNNTLVTHRNRNMAIVLLMLDSGLRLNEVSSLAVEDVDLQAASVRVFSAKTKKFRDVPLGPEVVVVLASCVGLRSSGPLFISQYRLPLSKNAIVKLVYRLQKKCGFPLHCHLFRHTFGRMYNRRGDIRKLQKILGHADMATTARFYTDPDFEDIQAEHKLVSPLAQLK